MSTVSTPPPDTVLLRLEPVTRATLDVERQALLATALPAEIVSPQEYQAIAADQARVVQFTRRVKPEFDEVVDHAHTAWKSAVRLRALFFDGLDAFNERARVLLGNYKAAQDRVRREAERVEAEAERERERKRVRGEARLLEKQGQPEMAAAVRAAPIVAPAVSLPSAVPVVAGLSYSTVWKWRIAGCTDANGGRKDKDARKRAAALVPRDFLDLDDAAITSRVTNMKSSTRIPGIEVFSEQVPVRRI